MKGKFTRPGGMLQTRQLPLLFSRLHSSERLPSSPPPSLVKEWFPQPLFIEVGVLKVRSIRVPGLELENYSVTAFAISLKTSLFLTMPTTKSASRTGRVPSLCFSIR